MKKWLFVALVCSPLLTTFFALHTVDKMQIMDNASPLRDLTTIVCLSASMLVVFMIFSRLFPAKNRR